MLSEFFSRFATGGAFIILGVYICWRALVHSDPSMLGPVMCVILALVLGMTGVVVVMRGGDLAEEPGVPGEGVN
jgi:hypothetical protein